MAAPNRPPPHAQSTAEKAIIAGEGRPSGRRLTTKVITTNIGIPHERTPVVRIHRVRPGFRVSSHRLRSAGISALIATAPFSFVQRGTSCSPDSVRDLSFNGRPLSPSIRGKWVTKLSLCTAGCPLSDSTLATLRNGLLSLRLRNSLPRWRIRASRLPVPPISFLSS